MSLRLLCAAAAASTIVACAMGGAQQSKAPAPAVAAAPAAQTMPQPNTPEDDRIAELANQIDAQRQQLGLAAPTPAHVGSVEPMDVHAPVAPTAPSTQPTCHPASDTCSQSCTLSGSICDNAKKICDIASELPGDAWASNKCVEGNETCAAAKKRCCDCAP